MIQVHCLDGKRTGMGTIAKAAHDGEWVYVDFFARGDNGRTLGWLRVPMDEVRQVLGQSMVDKIEAEAGRKLR